MSLQNELKVRIMKRTWNPPQLVILQRIKPEESVLTTCKGGGFLDTNTTFTVCGYLGCNGGCNTEASS